MSKFPSKSESIVVLVVTAATVLYPYGEEGSCSAKKLLWKKVVVVIYRNCPLCHPGSRKNLNPMTFGAAFEEVRKDRRLSDPFEEYPTKGLNKLMRSWQLALVQDIVIIPPSGAAAEVPQRCKPKRRHAPLWSGIKRQACRFSLTVTEISLWGFPGQMRPGGDQGDVG